MSLWIEKVKNVYIYVYIYGKFSIHNEHKWTKCTWCLGYHLVSSCSSYFASCLWHGYGQWWNALAGCIPWSLVRRLLRSKDAVSGRQSGYSLHFSGLWYNLYSAGLAHQSKNRDLLHGLSLMNQKENLEIKLTNFIWKMKIWMHKTDVSTVNAQWGCSRV